MTQSRRSIDSADGDPWNHRLIHLLNLIVLLVTAPLVLFPARFPVAAVAIGLALFLVAPVMRLLLVGRLTAPRAANWPVGFLLFVMTPIAVWVSPVPETTWPFMVRLLWGGALYFALLNWPTHRRGGQDGDGLPAPWQERIGVFMAVGLMVTVIDLVVLRLPYRIPGMADLDASRLGRFGFWLVEQMNHLPNENQLAGVAALYIPLLLVLSLGPWLNRGRTFQPRPTWAGGWFRVVCGVAAIYFLIVLALSGSRGGWTAGVFALGVVALLLGPRTRLIALVIGVIGVGVILWIGPLRLVNAVAVLDGETTSSATVSEGSVIEAALADRNLQGRFMIWERALHAIADNPLTGVGLGAFGHLAQQPYSLQPGYQPDPDIGYAHNMWLQVAVDTGIPGLVAMAALTLLVAKKLWQRFRASGQNSYGRYLSVAMTGSLCAFLIWGTLDAISIGSLEYWPIWCLYALSTTGEP